MVGAVLHRRDLRIGLALRQGVAVQQELRRRGLDEVLGHGLAVDHPGPLALDPHVSRVLLAGAVLSEILPSAVGGGDRAVVLLDAALHLLEHRRLQRQGRGHHGLAIGVLGGQVFLDVGLDQRGVAQHGLPVVVLHPLIVVDADAAQLLDADGDLLGDGRLGQGHRGSGSRTGECRGGGGEADGGGRGDQFAAIHQ
ncbi:hypothetical protein D3C86_1551580 [compost metagenome]